MHVIEEALLSRIMNGVFINPLSCTLMWKRAMFFRLRSSEKRWSVTTRPGTLQLAVEHLPGRKRRAVLNFLLYITHLLFDRTFCDLRAMLCVENNDKRGRRRWTTPF